MYDRICGWVTKSSSSLLLLSSWCEYLWGAYAGRAQGEQAKFRQTIQGSSDIQVPNSKQVARVCLANPSCGAEQTRVTGPWKMAQPLVLRAQSSGPKPSPSPTIGVYTEEGLGSTYPLS